MCGECTLRPRSAPGMLGQASVQGKLSIQPVSSGRTLSTSPGPLVGLFSSLPVIKNYAARRGVRFAAAGLLAENAC